VQIDFIADIVRLYRGNMIENKHDEGTMLRDLFPNGVYEDVPGFCKAATAKEIESQGWSLNPGRYIGTSKIAERGPGFQKDLREKRSELETLTNEARSLEQRILGTLKDMFEEGT